MKKGIIVVIAFLSLLMIAGTVFADAEYDAALKDYAGRNYREAVTLLKAYVEKKPDPAAYYLLGYSLYELGRFDEATGYFKQAYLIDPTFSPEKLGLAEEFPKVKAERPPRKIHGHVRANKKRKAHKRKKPAKTKRAAHGKCPAPAKKSSDGKAR